MSGICADLGRCAYSVVEGDSDTGCPWWADCFGAVDTADVSDEDEATRETT